MIIKNLEDFVNERKRQDVCEGCGKSIEDPNKECPHCGNFPHKAYHERAAAQTLGISKWIQNSPVMQPNQKITEKESTVSITRYSDFEDEFTGLDFFEESALEQDIDPNLSEKINFRDLAGKAVNLAKGKIDDLGKSLGISPEKLGTTKQIMDLAAKGVSTLMDKSGKKFDNKEEFRDKANKNPELQKVAKIFVDTLKKMITEIEKNPSAFSGPKIMSSIKNLLLTSTFVNKSAGGVSDK
jgi:hypothetical protein